MKTNPNDLLIASEYYLPDETEGKGLTKREYFAALAMQGLGTNEAWASAKSIAVLAVDMADTLIAELNRNKS